MKLLILILLSSMATAQTNHSSYRVALEKAVKDKCNITIDYVQTEMFISQDGRVFGEVTEIVSCPELSTPAAIKIRFSPPKDREDGSTLQCDLTSFNVDIDKQKNVSVQACIDDLCSIPATSVAIDIN